MLALRALFLSLIAVLLAVGGTVRAMPMPVAEPPCHEAPAHHDKQKPAQVAVNCCVGCMPAPTGTQVLLPEVPVAPTDYATVETSTEGRRTAPEPRPPRPFA